MEAQEIFNIVCEHLMKQNAKSMYLKDNLEMCLYRGPNGLKCAAGVLIDDADYTPEMENRRIGALVFECAALSHLFEHRILLHELQNIHDNYEVVNWSDRLRIIGAVEGLEIPDCIK